MIRFSRTVSSVSSVSACGTTPRRARMSGPSSTGSRPRMRSVPPVGGETQPIMRIVELLPAPFGPRKPNASPRWTSKSTPSTAVSSPKSLRRPRAWIIGSAVDAVALMRRAYPRVLGVSGCGVLECFGELGELVLVRELQLDATAADLRVEAREVLERVLHPRRECGIDGRCAYSRLLFRAGPFRALLGGANGQSLLHDLAGE